MKCPTQPFQSRDQLQLVLGGDDTGALRYMSRGANDLPIRHLCDRCVRGTKQSIEAAGRRGAGPERQQHGSDLLASTSALSCVMHVAMQQISSIPPSNCCSCAPSFSASQTRIVQSSPPETFRGNSERATERARGSVVMRGVSAKHPAARSTRRARCCLQKHQRGRIRALTS